MKLEPWTKGTVIVAVAGPTVQESSNARNQMKLKLRVARQTPKNAPMPNNQPARKYGGYMPEAD